MAYDSKQFILLLIQFFKLCICFFKLNSKFLNFLTLLNLIFYTFDKQTTKDY